MEMRSRHSIEIHENVLQLLQYFLVFFGRMVKAKTMKKTHWLAAAAAAVLVLGVSACGSSSGDAPIGGDVIAPVTMSVNELQGADVELLVGQVLNINTDSLAVDSYQGEVSDTKVARFVEGKVDGSATFNPGVEGLAEGTAEVTMVNDQGGIQPLEFTVTVVAN